MAGAEGLSAVWLVDALFAVVGVLGGIVYKTHLANYKEDKRLAEERRREDRTADKEQILSIRSAANQEMSHLKRQIEDQRLHAARLEGDAARREATYWTAINSIKETQSDLKLFIASKYHDKEDISRLLDEKIEPIFEALRELKVSSQFRRRSGDDQ